MKRVRIASVIPIALLAVAGSGCGTSPAARFYTLDSTVTAAAASALNVSVVVGPVTLPAAVDRPQFVVQVSANRVELDEFSRWAAPLDDGMARAVAGNPGVLLGTRHAAAGPIANFSPDYRVTIDVQRFDSIPAQGVVLDAVWTVRDGAGGKPIPGRSTARMDVADPGRAALAAAHSSALATMSSDIATAIRSHASEKESAPKKKK